MPAWIQKSLRLWIPYRHNRPPFCPGYIEKVVFQTHPLREYVFAVVLGSIAPSSQELEPPANPGRSKAYAKVRRISVQEKVRLKVVEAEGMGLPSNLLQAVWAPPQPSPTGSVPVGERETRLLEQLSCRC